MTRTGLHETTEARAVGREFRTDIQGLRAIAVAAVVLYHAGVPGLGGGYVGVDVFFVISGYLITGHLYSEYQATGNIQIGRFYARRVMRLLPASFLVLAVTLVLSRLFLPPLEFSGVASAGRATALYVLNMYLAHTNTSYLANTAASPFQHYWSLGVEEQFYLVLPLLLLLALRLVRGRVGRLLLPAAVLCVVSLACCVYLTGYKQPWGFFWLPSRAWEFGLGALIALAASHTARFRGPAAMAVSWAGLAAIVACVCLYGARTQFPGIAAAGPAVGTALVIAGGQLTGRGGADEVLRLWPLQFVGGISYSLYLWHWPLLTIPDIDRDQPLGALERTGIVALSVVLGWLTSLLVEKRFRSLPSMRRQPVRAYAVLAALTVLAFGGSTALGRLPTLHSNQALPAWPANWPTATTLSQPLPVAASVGVNLAPSLVSAVNDVPSINSAACIADFTVTAAKTCVAGDLTAGSDVVLFGDSHAEQWFPAVSAAARAESVKLDVLIKSSCPPLEVSVFNTRLGRTFTECATWRRNAIAEINRLHPKAIVISHYLGEQLDAPGPDPLQTWRTGLTQLLAELPSTSKVVLLGDSPHWAYSPLTCLSAHLSSATACSKPLADVVDVAHSAAEKAVVTAHGGRFLDTASWTCPAGQCPAILFNVPVYRDVNHVTATFAAHFAPMLEPVLRSDTS